MLGAGYIPKLHWTDALANSEGLFAYHRYAEASFILTCRTPDGTGSGWAGHDRAEGRHADRRRGHQRNRGAQGAEVAQGARARARQLHGDPRAAAGGAVPVADARLAQRAPGGRGPQLHERRRARRDEARAEGVRRQRHDPQRHRQQRSAADADRPRRPRGASRSPGSRRASSRTWPTTASGRTSRTSRPRRRRRSRAW